MQESRKRAQAAVKNAALTFPRQQLTANLALADLFKQGPAHDLPIELGDLAASEQTQPNWLDGSLRHGRGMLPMAALARRQGVS